MEPVRMKTTEFDEGAICYFCTMNLPEEGKDGIVWYRAKTSFRWEAVSVCEMCWRVAEEVRGWYE